MKNWLKILIAIVIFAIIYALFQYFKPQRDIANEDASAQVTSTVLINDFSKNLNDAHVKYLNKTIEVSGKVTSVEGNLVSLDEVVSCVMSKNENLPKVGNQVTIKGKLIGFENDILTEIKLSECVIKN